MGLSFCGLKDRLISIGICVCGVLVLSTTLRADNTVFTLGGWNSSTGLYYGSEYVGPYPGSIIPDTPQTDSLIVAAVGPVFCLDADQTNYFGGTYYGVQESLAEANIAAGGSNQDVEEAAFLASLMMYDAQQEGIDVTWNGSGSGLTLYQTQVGNVSVGEFVSQVEGPISFAIWQIMGTLGNLSTDPNAQFYVAQAQAAYSKVLKNSSDPIVAAFNAEVMVFIPDGSSAGTQRFLSADLDIALMDEAAPEPGTLVMFGTGLVLMALGCARRVRRPR
jgi:hypothetical protein